MTNSLTMSFESTTTLPLASTNNSQILLDRNGASTPGLDQNPYTVLATAGARVYHTKLTAEESQWTYSRWKGTLSFCRDIDTPSTISKGVSETEKHWFRLADDETGRTVWMFKFPENFDYTIDRPFFQVFQGRVC
ncbi:hypothetical protein CPB83DRAFT_859796 [Crepidotus variabilis]|uniref:Uncharacterized protein n=1 Tax=Crepidotus variabilis TaxID=179855 RepID=A0A9P6EAB7_9AGAR|nr:hypothetical protein CPB83DRAFT_859796 [Crepidotus variabilis]